MLLLLHHAVVVKRWRKKLICYAALERRKKYNWVCQENSADIVILYFAANPSILSFLRVASFPASVSFSAWSCFVHSFMIYLSASPPSWRKQRLHQFLRMETVEFVRSFFFSSSLLVSLPSIDASDLSIQFCLVFLWWNNYTKDRLEVKSKVYCRINPNPNP